MKDAAEMARLRTLLKNVNVEYSALLRGTGHEGKVVRLEALKEQRLALMSSIAELRRRRAAEALPPSEPSVAKHSQTGPLLALVPMATAMAATVRRKWAWLGSSEASSSATAVPSSE
jgi:hypothetical protein